MRPAAEMVRQSVHRYRRRDHLHHVCSMAYWWHDGEDFGEEAIRRLRAILRDIRRDTSRPGRTLRYRAVLFALAGEMVMAGRYIRSPKMEAA